MTDVPPGTFAYAGYLVHKVVPGDNLSFIAWRYGTTAGLLFVWADGRLGPNPDAITPGQLIVVGKAS